MKTTLPSFSMPLPADSRRQISMGPTRAALAWVWEGPKCSWACGVYRPSTVPTSELRRACSCFCGKGMPSLHCRHAGMLYIDMYVYACIYISINVCVYIYIHLCICVCVCVRVCFCMCMSICICICVCICICICVYMYTYVYVYIYIYVCIYIYRYIYI